MSNSNTVRRPIQESRIWKAYERSRYAILFYALLLTLLMMPIFSALGLSSLLVRLLIGACLLAAVMPNATRRTRQLLFAGVILLIIAQFAADEGELPTRPAYVLALIALTGLASAAGALRFVVTARTVNSESVYAALATYLLAGLFFGQVYLSVEAISPGSMTGPERFTDSNAVYFSFVTLATLGYGDFLPRSTIARGIATFEVVGGQLFLAVLVARLIGAFASPSHPEEREVTRPRGE